MNSTRFAYLRTGQIDLYDGLTGKDARSAEAEFPDTVKVYSTTSYVGDPFTMNAARAPFDDIRVRKAIAYSVNHDEALKVLMDGDGVVGGLLIPGPWSISAEELAAIPGYGKDVEANRAEARRLLAEAGFPDGFETTLTARKAAGTHEAARPLPRGPVLQDRGQGDRQGAGKRGLLRDDEEPRFRHGDQRHLGVEQRPGLHDRRLPHLRRRAELLERLRRGDRRPVPAPVGRDSTRSSGRNSPASWSWRRSMPSPPWSSTSRASSSRPPAGSTDTSCTRSRTTIGATRTCGWPTPDSPWPTRPLTPETRMNQRKGQFRGLDHIDIVVEDVAAMQAFFESVGFELIRQTDHGGGAVELRFPGEGDQPILELTPLDRRQRDQAIARSAPHGAAGRRHRCRRHRSRPVADCASTSRRASLPRPGDASPTWSILSATACRSWKG